MKRDAWVTAVFLQGKRLLSLKHLSHFRHLVERYGFSSLDMTVFANDVFLTGPKISHFQGFTVANFFSTQSLYTHLSI